MIETINQIFGLFRLNFGNLYYASFKSQELEDQAKRLWLETLRDKDPRTLLMAAKSVITHFDYMPTLKTMLDHYHKVGGQALPDVHAAYVEACQAPSPKAQANWSHPAVYHAGKASDWFFLQSNSEATALPVFRRHYQELCERVRDGATLPAPEIVALPEKIETQLSNSEQQEKLAELRRTLDL